MKQKKLLFSLIGVCLLLGFSSCSSEDKSVFGDDFEIPELTDANTIQFTVDASGEWKVIEMNAGGGRIAIEWGDGRLQKIEHPDNASIQYRYKPSRSFTVRVWAEELTAFSVSGVLMPVSNMHLGDFPRMKRIELNSIKESSFLDLNTSCPNLEYMNIGNWEGLEELHFDECLNLKTVQVYTNPKLTSIKLGHCEFLTSLYCIDNGITSLSLKKLPALHTVELTGTPQLSALEIDDDNMISVLHIEGCVFRKLDFLNKLMSLTELYCSSNKLTDLDTSGNKKLWYLDCYNNQLKSLSIPMNNNLRKLDCRYNKLDKDQLNNIFNTLPDVTGYPAYYDKCVIMYKNNPGAADCNETILQNKHWRVN